MVSPNSHSNNTIAFFYRDMDDYLEYYCDKLL